MVGKRGPYKKRPIAVRLVEKVKIQQNGCWLWTGHVSPNGYARISVGGVERQAHRVAYEEFVGPIPDGLDVDHVCHNEDRACSGGPSCAHRRCLNPEHLAPATRSDNLRNSGRVGNNGSVVVAAGIQTAKTHCPQGHPYDAENTYSPPSRPNARYCRECHRDHTRARRARLRQDTQ